MNEFKQKKDKKGTVIENGNPMDDFDPEHRSRLQFDHKRRIIQGGHRQPDPSAGGDLLDFPFNGFSFHEPLRHHKKVFRLQKIRHDCNRPEEQVDSNEQKYGRQMNETLPFEDQFQIKRDKNREERMVAL